METAIVHASVPITLIGGGEVGPQDLAEALTLAPRLVAADGGAAVAMASGHMPEAVIGDLDSLDERTRAAIPSARLFPVREQDSTDFDKALRSIRAPLVLAVGFLGARVDHQLAAFNAVIRRSDRPCILIGTREILCHVPRRMILPAQHGDTVSLFPMRPVTGRSEGLEWPIDGLHLAPDGRIGTSNRATGPVTLDMAGPGLLVILPRARLGALTRQFHPG